jgi:hypothetical protein
VPTQGGGKFVESHGNIFKDIRISGTVGIRPNPTSGNLLDKIPGASKVTGLTVSRPSSLVAAQDLERAGSGGGGVLGRFTGLDARGLDAKEATGFDDIVFLRNIFRLYFDIKRNNRRAHRVVMIWRYAKESETYIVEPTSFTTSRDSSSPLSYTYNITMRTLYRFDDKIQVERDPLSALETIAAGISIVNQSIRDIGRALEQIATVVDFVVQLPLRIADNVVSSALTVLGGLSNFATIGDRFETVYKGLLKSWSGNIKEMTKWASAQEAGRAAGDKRVFGGAIELALDDLPDIPNIPASASLSIHRNPAINAGRMLNRTANQIITKDFLFSSPKQVDISKISNAYNVDGQPPPSGGSPLNLQNVSLPSSAREATVKGGETIRGLAKRTMGNAAYWKAIVVLNDAKPPYISDAGGPGVFSKGDKILIPQVGDEGDLAPVGNELNPDANSQDLSPVVRAYGRDIKLSDSSFGTDYADLQVSQTGDLELIEGVDNVKQAMFIKFSTEEGDLAIHPLFGAQYTIGSKLRLTEVQDFALNTRATMLSDSRVEDVTELKTIATGDIINVSAKASLRQVDASVPITFAVRRI